MVRQNSVQSRVVGWLIRKKLPQVVLLFFAFIVNASGQSDFGNNTSTSRPAISTATASLPGAFAPAGLRESQQVPSRQTLEFIVVLPDEDVGFSSSTLKLDELGFDVILTTVSSLSSAGKRYLDQVGADILPAVLMRGANLEDVAGDGLPILERAGMVVRKGDYFVLAYKVRAGIYFKRKKIPGRLDMFVMSLCPFGNIAVGSIMQAKMQKKMPEKLDMHVHYILSPLPADVAMPLKSMHGLAEVEEDIRQLVVEKYFPDKWPDYMLLRSKNFESTYWDDAARGAGLDPEIVRSKAREEGEALLRENAALARELRITASPLFLYENRRILNVDGFEKLTGIQIDTEGSCDGK